MLAVAFALNSIPGRAVTEYKEIIDVISNSFSGNERTLLILLLIPVMTEIAFRGLLFSFIEKLHYIPSILFSAAAYAAVAYFTFYKFGMWSYNSSAAASVAFFVALGVGLVLGTVTWRLRSVIPAVLMGLLMANATSFVQTFNGLGSAALPLSVIVLVIALALLVFLPTLFAKRFPIFAYDFPFTQHHKHMRGRLANRALKKKAVSKRNNTKDEQTA